MNIRTSMRTGAAAILFTLALGAAPAPALAQSCVNNVATPSCAERAKTSNFITNPACKCCGSCELSDFVGLTVEVSRFLFGIAGALALAMVAVGGFWWLTAAGSADRIDKGRKTLVAAVIGLAIVFSAWAIVNTILAALTGQVDKHGAAQILGGTWWRIPK